MGLTLTAAAQRRIADALADLPPDLRGGADDTPLPPADVWASEALGVDLDPWQIEAMLSDAPTLLAVCCRQSGKSTIIGARAAYDALRHPGERSLVLAPTFRQSRLLADKIAAPLRRKGVQFEQTRDDIRLANGSIITVLPGEADTIRGHSVSSDGALIIDEAAYIGRPLWASAMPMIAATGGRLICLTSPAAPSGTVYEMHNDPEVHLIRVKAADLPRFDAALIERLRRRLGPERASQELDAEFGQVQGGIFSAAVIANIFAPKPGGSGPSPAETQAQEQTLAERWEAQKRREHIYSSGRPKTGYLRPREAGYKPLEGF